MIVNYGAEQLQAFVIAVYPDAQIDAYVCESRHVKVRYQCGIPYDDAGRPGTWRLR